jgi:hypothetical protein
VTPPKLRLGRALRKGDSDMLSFTASGHIADRIATVPTEFIAVAGVISVGWVQKGPFSHVRALLPFWA